jgi:mRNA interferase RelE/StbE
VSGEPQTPGPETSLPYTAIFSRQARRNPHENLPLDVAVAAMETLDRWRGATLLLTSYAVR